MSTRIAFIVAIAVAGCWFVAVACVGVAALARDDSALSILNLPRAARHLWALCALFLLCQVAAAVCLALGLFARRLNVLGNAGERLLSVLCAAPLIAAWLWGLAVLCTTYERDQHAITRHDRLLWVYFHLAFWTSTVVLGAASVLLCVRLYAAPSEPSEREALLIS